MIHNSSNSDTKSGKTTRIRPSLKRIILRESLKFNTFLQPIQSDDNDSSNSASNSSDEDYDGDKENNEPSPSEYVIPPETTTPKATDSLLRRSSRNRHMPRTYNQESDTESKETQEAYINYNSSNTPKFMGKFYNIQVGNKLKRECKLCSLRYNDLKGFNRHYKSIHLSAKQTPQAQNRR